MLVGFVGLGDPIGFLLDSILVNTLSIFCGSAALSAKTSSIYSYYCRAKKLHTSSAFKLFFTCFSLHAEK